MHVMNAESERSCLRRIARKERQKLQALEDQRRLAKTKMRERKLRKMEQLMEEATAVPVISLKATFCIFRSNLSFVR